MRVRLLIGLLLMVCAAAASPAEPALTAAECNVVNAADYADRTSPTAGLQQAVDALPEKGGVVTIPAGAYVLRQSIHLRSNVTLQGAGPSTLLRKKKHAESRLAATARQGSQSVRVVDASGFGAGDQVAIRDKDAMGWNVVQAIITAVQGSELLLDRPMPRTCDATKMGFVIHAFPALTADRASKIVIKDLDIKDDAVRDLSIYGPLDNPRAKWAIVLPFHVAAIHLNFVADSRVEGCSVAGWLSDGISVQGGAVKGPSAGHNTVADCVVQKCGGIGLHPGGGLHDSVFSHNISRGNGGDGLYFCAGVQRVTVSENQLVGNKHNGIGGLGDSGDKYNLVTNNVCAENGQSGILLCDGDNNTVAKNICRNNSQSAPGQYSGILLTKTSLSVVRENRCFDDQQNKTQKHGIEELAGCRENTITGNDCRGNLQGDLVLAAGQPVASPDAAPRRGRGSAAAPSADQPQPAPARGAGRGRGRDAAPAADQPQPARPQASPGGRGDGAAPPVVQQSAVPMKVGPPQIVDYTDPTYGATIRQLRKDDGHEHNFYYYRDPWNADGSRMLGIQSDLGQKDWRVCLYDGDGVFLQELFPISKYDWRLCWDRNNPDVLYTWKGSDLYRFSVVEGQAELLKSFAPLGLMPNGPSCNQSGDRILVVTSDRVFRSYHLPEMSDERTFKITIPEGCVVSWDKPHYLGCRNYIDTAYRGSQPSQGGIVVYDDTGQVVHKFDAIGAGGHYDWSPDGTLAYFKLPTGGRGQPSTPLEIHVVNLDGAGDRVLFSVPREKAHFHNLHLSWPREQSDWFVAGFFPSGPSATAKDVPAQTPRGGREAAQDTPATDTPSKDRPERSDRAGRPTPPAKNPPARARGAARPGAGAKNAPGTYEPPFDEILMLRLDGTTKYLARTGTVYSAPGGRGRSGDMFWAQPLPRPSADGKRICFNSSRSGTIDLHILYTEGGPPKKGE